ncbi:hypothetical protein LCGC14_1807350 [marine sediment metagenome]|uniref:Uncharacterized protein n=2 Tax=root TaxID=1 RepID=A0A831QNL2_9FLAO|nr:hypothetical protein [Pricia antarctica]
MQTNTEETAAAVKDLLSRQDISDYCKELSLMHSAFIRSDFADEQRTRIMVDATYQNVRDFLLALQSINSKTIGS